VSTPAALAGLLDFRRLDLLAAGETALHRLDARAKVPVALVFIACVMSFGRYAVTPLLPYFVFPMISIAAARLPAMFLLRKIALVLPIALVIGLPNALFDHQVLMQLGEFRVTGGWISMLSILLRALLAAATALTLVAVTGFPAICGALERMGVPRPLTVQLLLVYRYLSLLGEEALRMTVARDQRSDGRPLSIRACGSLVGRLLLRTWDRAERIHLAMCARGFNGEFPGGGTSRMGWRELAYLVGWCGLFLLLRFGHVTPFPGGPAPGLLQ
jgi:cobalt/nickel transport system permease protein